VVLDSEQPLLGPDGHSQGHTTAAAAAGGLWMVVVKWKECGGTMFGNCPLPNIANIINQSFNY
jgi:hypothetical protein